ncbi:hypothetical protein ANTPLA_LOCUS2256 [Anthophora plagiata]
MSSCLYTVEFTREKKELKDRIESNRVRINTFEGKLSRIPRKILHERKKTKKKKKRKKEEKQKEGRKANTTVGGFKRTGDKGVTITLF